MKMDFTSGIFWGSILVLIGLSILLKVIFDIDIPILRVLFAALLIYWGVKLIMGISFKKDADKTVVFGNEKINYSNEKKEYNTIFGKSAIDLTNISTTDTVKPAEINVIFGSTDIYISESSPLRLKSSSAFGAVYFPDETVISFGERTYTTSAAEVGGAIPEVKVNVVFGNANIKRRIP